MGSSIFKKLLFDKKLTDIAPGQTIAQWKINPWKVFGILFSFGILGIIIYGFLFSGNPNNFFGNVVLYAIIIAIAIAVIYILAKTISKFRKLFVVFIIAFILIFILYWVMGIVFTYTGLIKNWYIGGYSLWMLIIFLAGMGAKLQNNELEKKDVLYGFLVFLLLLGVNIPMANNMGFVANLDNIIGKILGLVPWKL